VCCSVLQCVAAFYSVLQNDAVRCKVNPNILAGMNLSCKNSKNLFECAHHLPSSLERQHNRCCSSNTACCRTSTVDVVNNTVVVILNTSTNFWSVKTNLVVSITLFVTEAVPWMSTTTKLFECTHHLHQSLGRQQNCCCSSSTVCCRSNTVDVINNKELFQMHSPRALLSGEFTTLLLQQ